MAINMHIATALIVQRATLECLRRGVPLANDADMIGTLIVSNHYHIFTSSADADHLTADDLRTIRNELAGLGWRVS